MQVVANAGTLAMTGFDDSLNIYLGAVTYAKHLEEDPSCKFCENLILKNRNVEPKI